MKTKTPVLGQEFLLRCIFAWALVSLAGSGTYAQSTAAGQTPKVVQINEIGNTAHVALNVGDTLRVILHATPSTGYGWQIAENNNAILEAGEKKYLPPEAKKPGASGRQSLAFTAKSAGRDKLLLAYARPWEKNAVPARSLSLEIVIRDAGLQGDPAFAVKPAGVLLARYAAKLPCADCSAIQETLSLYSPGPNQFQDAYYVDAMTYLGGHNGDSTFVTAGKWFLSKGTPFDPNASVYMLNLDSTDRDSNYLVKQDALEPLDSELNLIHSPFSMSLRRIP